SVPFTKAKAGTGNYLYSHDFNNGGVFEVAGDTLASAPVPPMYVADGPATQLVRGRVTDGRGVFTDYTTKITINNRPPTVTLGSSFAGTAGSAVSFSASVSDPSPADTAAGFRYAWDFGDGSTSTQAAPAHAYATPGSYAVKLTVTDKDGG